MLKKKQLWISLVVLLIIISFSVFIVNDQKVDVVAFGDSNTENVNWEEYNYDPDDKWVRLLEKETGLIIANEGVGGDSSKKGKWRLIKDVFIRNPDKVLIMFGTNDAILEDKNIPQINKETYKKNIQYLIDKTKMIGATPILMTSVPMIEGNSEQYYYSRHNPEFYNDYGGARNWHNSYNDIVRDLAKSNGIPLIDNWEAFIKAAGGNNDELLINAKLMDDSGTHMTPKGAEILYETIKKSGVLN